MTMIGFGNASNDFTKLMARKIAGSGDIDGEYMSQTSSSSTNIEALSRLSVHLAEETKFASS